MTPWLWWTGLFTILVLGPATVLLSEDGPYFSMVEDSPLFSDQLTGRSGQALGAVARGGYFTGPAVGRVKGIAPLELMPYMFFDQGMVLGDIRGFRADNGYWGTNLGLGYRHYVSPWDRIFGANFFYDYDNTSTQIFRQIGFGLETYGKWWDMRGNAYFPIGTQSQLLNTQVSPGSQRFAGHQLLFDLINTYGTALKGADAEIGIPLSLFGEVAQVHDMRMYAGGYHYESDTTGGFNGWSGRIQGDLIPSLLLQLIVTNDSHFDTNVVFGATWSFGGFKQPPEERKNQFSRMTTPIWRQYTISIDRTDVLLPDQVAVNPSTGNPYFIDHVDSNASGVQNGTFENPFQSLNNPGIAADRASNVLDIVYVHGDSVYNTSPNNSVSLLEGYSANRFLRYLGEGDSITHTVPVLGLGSAVPLPAAPAGSVRPTFNNATGNGVTLANFTEFSGFIINNPSGNGLFGSGVHDVDLNQNVISNAGGDGALFLNAGGNIDIGNLQITNPTGIGFHVTGGTPVIRFSTSQPSQITNSGAAAVVVSDTLADSSVNMSGASVSNTNSSNVGVLISNVAGGFALGDATIQNSSSYGIQIIDTTGAANFNGSVNIINPGDNGIQISNLGAAGSASFNGTTQIGSRNAIGINLLSIAGAVAFSGDTTIGTPATGATAAPGVNWQGSLAGSTTSFGSITITDSGTDGFALGTVTANAGEFQVSGPATVGGTTSGIGVNIANNTSNSRVRFNSTLGVSGRTNQGVRVLNNGGTVTFTGIATIDNPNNSVFPAVDLQGNTGIINFGTLTINDATGTGSLVDPNTYGVGLNIMDNPASVAIEELNVTATDGIALFAESMGASTALSGFLSVNGGILSSTSASVGAGTPTIDISNSSYTTVKFTSVTNTNSSREGIRLVNNAYNSQTGDASNIPTFSITGQNNAAGSGGTIDGAAAQGLLATNTGGIFLNNMNFLNNLVGIQAETTDATLPTLELSVSNLQVSNSTHQGIYALSTQVVNVANSTFSGNGSGGDIKDNDVRLIANLVDPNGLVSNIQTYSWAISNTDFSDNSAADIADTIFASNVRNAVYSDITGGGLNATMVTSVISNANDSIFVLGGAAKDGINIIWGGNTSTGNGATYLPSTIQGYTINLNGDDKTGISFQTVTANAATDFGGLYILSNNIIGNGDGNIGIDVLTAGRSQILIDNAVNSTVGNAITLNQGVTTTGTTGIGMRFSLGTNSQVFVRHATIGLAPTSADGIVFTNVQAPGSLVELSDNVINYASTSSGVAINFQSVISGTLAIQRSNSPENFVNWQGFAPTLFLPDPAPSGWFSNTINVNGIEFGQ